MKRKQWAALVLSAILSFSACIPATGTGVYAAENDVTQETVFEEAAESAFEETAEAPAFAGEDAGGDALTGDSAADPFAAENTEAEIPQAFEDAGAIEAPEEAAVNAAEPAGEEAAASEAGTAFEEADPFAAEAGTEDTGFSAPADTAGSEGTEFDTGADPAATEGTEFDAAADPAGAEGTEFEIPAEEADDAFEEISAPADTAASESTEFDAAAADPAGAEDTAFAAPASDPFAETPSDPADAAAGEEQTFLTEDGQEEAVSEKGQNSSIEPTEENFASAADIAAGDVLDVNITREAPAFFRFIPAETGGYKIYSTNETNCDPGLILYDESGCNIGSADDENGSDFSYKAVFNEGSVYYLQAYCYGSEAVYQIHLEKQAFFVEHGETERYVAPGEEVTLEAKAVSSSSLSYQWYLNDAPVEGETSSTFTFTPESHCYASCSVSDEDGNSENVNYEIFFETGLTASAAGDSTFSLDPGSSQTLAVEASANEGIELSYRWFNRTTEEYIESDSGDPARCTIENLQSYTEIICYVSDPYGNEILVWFYLKVNGNLPVWPNGANIGEDSFTCSVNRGDDYQLYVNSNSDAELSYAWYDENDTLLQEGGTNYYNLENIQDDCTIRCHVSETENPDMAKDLYFHVKLAVEITLRPEADIDYDEEGENDIRLSILNHDEVTLRAVAETTGETEGMTYRWFKEDYDEDEGYKWSVIPDAASDSLTISLPVAGSYYCEARDTDGNNAFAYYYLTGNGGVSAYDSNYGWNSVTLDADTLESPALDLSVTADCEANDRLTYQWYRLSDDGYTPIDGAVSSSYTLENPQNGTSYYCLVDSGYGGQDTVYYYFRRNNNLSVYADNTKNSSELTLDPREADSFTLTPAVEADDTEGLQYLWTYTGSNGKEDPADNTGASLTVTGPENNDSYNCLVTDRYGNSANAYYRFFADTHLEVYAEGDTRKDNDFYINISGMDSLTLTGAADADEGTPLTWSWEKNNTAIDGETGTFTGSGKTSLLVDSPEADDIYRFRAEDNYGNSDYVDFHLVSETTPLRIYPDGGNEGDDSIDVNLSFDQNPAKLYVHVAECIDDLALKYVWKNEAGEVLSEAFEDSTYWVYDPVDGAKYSCTAIDQFGQEATVWFTLHVELDPNGPTKEEFENAQEIRAGETAEVTLNNAEDYRMFRFTAEKDGVYLLYSSNHSGNQDPQARLYGQDYRENSYFDDAAGNYDFRIARSCKAGETWYLKAYDREAGTYSLHLEETDLYAEADRYPEWNEYIGSRAYLYVLAYSASELHYQWYEGDEDGTEASFREIEGAVESEYTYTVERSSSFRCRVTDDEGHSKDVVFRITAEVDRRPQNSDFENAKELKPGNPVTASLTEDKFADFYKFTADEAGRYRFTAAEASGNISADIDVYRKFTYKDDDGGTYDSYEPDRTGIYESFTQDLEKDETIYLRVYFEDYRPGSFTLQAEQLPFWAEASSETSPNVHYGESVDLTVKAWSSSTLHYQWYTSTSYGREGTPIEGAADSAAYTHTATKDQNIYCMVRDDAGNSDRIDFYIYLIRDPSEADFAAADVITAGEEKEVRTTEKDFARFFKFTPEKTGAYSVQSVVPEDDSNNASTYADIYDENYDYLSTVSEEEHSWNNFSYTFMADAGKTYYIRTWSDDYLPAVYSIRLEGLSFYAVADESSRSKDIYADPFSAEEIILEPIVWSDSDLHYQWFVHDNYWAEGDGTAISGANDKTFTVPDKKTCAYSCLVSDDHGNKETLYYHIKINNELALSSKETDISCEFDSKQTLSVTATAKDKEDLSYSWYKYDDNYEPVEISGADGTTLTTDPIRKYEYYYCTVTDKFGNRSSIDFRISVENGFDVYPDPSVGTIQDDDDVVVEFDSTDTPRALEVKVNADDKEGISYKWYYGSDAPVRVGDNSPRLVPDHRGWYECTVTDKFGNYDNVYFYVKINNDLKASASGDTTVEAYAGSSAALKVTATALNKDSIVYKWYETNENGNNWTRIENADTSTPGTCVIPSVDRDAYYVCEVTDTYGNYCEKDIYFTVKKLDPIDISGAEVTLAADGLTYDGKAKTPAVTVKYDGKALTAGTDYDVTYTGNISAGTNTAKATVTGKGKYKGTVEKTFSIAKAAQDLKAGNLSIAFSASGKLTVTGAQGAVTYTSSTPAVAAVAADGTVTGRAIGSAKITVSAAGNDNYQPAHTEATVTVTAAKLTAGHVTVDAEGLVYNGKDQTPAVTVKYGSTVLTAGTDYDLTYENNKDAGTDTAKAIVTGRGNYTGTAEKTFSIAKADHKITAKAAKTTLSATQKTTIKVTGAKGKVSYKSNKTTVATVDANGNVTAKAVGTATITVTDAGNANYNKAAAVKVIIKVTPKATTKLTAVSQAKGIKLTWAKVAGANGYIIYRNTKKVRTITSGSTVTWTDTGANTNGTKYTFKVVAKAATGTSALSKSLDTYHVARPAISSAANTAAKKMTVKWKENAKASGYEIQYTLKSSFSGAKSVKITKAATVSKVIGGLQKGKTYYIRIRTYKTVGKTKYYSAWSASKKLKITK